MNPSIICSSIADQGRVRVGAGLKSSSNAAPQSVVDAGNVRLGAGLKLPPASVKDVGSVRIGAGLKRR